jgi:hypothetical protein
LNGFLVALGCIGGAVLYAVVGVLVTRKYIHPRIAEGHNDVLAPLFLTAGVIYAVLLGFMVVTVWGSYNDAHANVADEAATLVPLYRETFEMVPAEGAQMRKLLRGYAEAVAAEEWPSIRDTGHTVAKARTFSGDMLRLVGKFNPPTKIKEIISTQFLQTYSQMLLDRNRRVFQASESLSWIMWLGVIGGAVIVIGMSFVLFMESRTLHVLLAAVMAALIGTSIFTMVLLNRPFVGPLAIDPGPFESRGIVFDEIDQGQ